MTELIKLKEYPVKDFLKKLLQDKTTKMNIKFAGSTYEAYGYSEKSQMTEGAVLGFSSCDIQPRVCKSLEEQGDRTRKKAEVFTPAWVVNKMNNHCDTEWFGKPNVFNSEKETKWVPANEKIIFPKDKSWKDYIDSRRMEITCGEAPYIVSRYDSTSGEIIPIENRIGILDRKMRIVNENALDESEWLSWTYRAFQSVYGYEFQGDNLLIARINLLMTFCDYLKARWNRDATKSEIAKIINIICWNFWQMDGLKNVVPFGKTREEYSQSTWWDIFPGEELEKEEKETDEACLIYDWRNNHSKLFKEIEKRGNGMKFDFVIGNPPYQDQSNGDKKADASIYNFFMEAAYGVSEKVELITPARFLFNNGNTPADWNLKMLSDKHFKVLDFRIVGSDFFPSTDIKGGVAIHYRDETKDFGEIGCFTAYSELNGILKKVNSVPHESITTIIFNQNCFNLTKLYEDYPQLKHIISSNGKEKRLTSGCIGYECFTQTKSENCIEIIGLINNKRCRRFIRSEYIDTTHEGLYKYKVILPANNGSGAIGEVLSTPLIGEPLIGYTQTFISIGAFDSREQAEACMKYIKTKFARTMLGVLKVTQNGKKPVWKYVPLQDFTSDSDIDWSVSVAKIDRQLYRKYGLSAEEIEFIETHVKGME